MHSLALLVLFFCLLAEWIYFLKNHGCQCDWNQAWFLRLKPKRTYRGCVVIFFVSVLIRLNSFLCRVILIIT